MIKIKLLMRGINEFDITQEKVGSNYYGTVIGCLLDMIRTYYKNDFNDWLSKK